MTHPADKIPAKKSRSRCLILIIFAWIIGALLLNSFSGRFAFYYADIYTRVALWSSLVIAPFILYRMKRAVSFVDEVAKKYPTGWLRSLIVMPLMALAATGLLFVGPLGWLFAAAAFSGGAIQRVDAIVAKVGTYSQRKGCDQQATLQFASAEKELCIDGLYPHSSLYKGQPLNVGITVFPFGFLIVSIAP